MNLLVSDLKLLIYSASDPAGINIARHLGAILPFAPSEVDGMPAGAHGDLFLVEIDSSLIDLDLRLKGVEWALCLSRHKSSSGKPCQTGAKGWICRLRLVSPRIRQWCLGCQECVQ